MRSVFIIFLIFLLCSCTRPMSYEQAMATKIKEFSPQAQSELAPYFRQAGLAYPPRQLAFLIFKNEGVLQLYGRDKGNWKFVRSFNVLGHSGTFGPKLHSGDRQIPEGIYRLTELNPQSHYDLSMRVDYPNEMDKHFAAFDQRLDLGGDIYIHGDSCSAGCVALGNPVIQQLFPLVYAVGSRNVIVIIAPNDLRKASPIYGEVRPSWLPTLYRQIRDELKQFR